MKKSIFLTLFMFPGIVFAQPKDSRTFSYVIGKLVDVIESILPVLAGLALLAFLWGLTKFIYRVGGDEKAVNDGKNLMIWGVVALFVLVSFMGIIAFFQADLGVGGKGPYLPTSAE